MNIVSIIYALIASTSFILLYIRAYKNYFDFRNKSYIGILFVLVGIYAQFFVVAYCDVNIGYTALFAFIVYLIGLTIIYRTNIFNILFLSLNAIVKIYLMFLFFGAVYAAIEGVPYDPHWIKNTYYFALSQGHAYLLSIGSLYLADVLLLKNKLKYFFQLKRNLLLLISIQIIIILNFAWLSFTNIAVDTSWYNNMLLITSLSLEIIYFLLRLFTASSSYFSSYKLHTELLSKQLSSQIEHYKTYEEQMKNFAKFKHDYDKVFSSITNLLALKNYEAIEKILSDYSDELQLMMISHKNYSNNLILDALLNDYTKRFTRIQTEFVSNTYIKFGSMTDLKLIKLFYNILENAYEALLKVEASHRTMEIKSEILDNYLKISFVNTTNQMIDTGDKTSKIDKRNHGFGLSIINNILIEHDGFSNSFITLTDDVPYYHLEIFLPLD